jgi:prepilin peptidase CpaA
MLAGDRGVSLLPPLVSTGACVLVVILASVTDLRQRRIPNHLTFPALGFGLAAHLWSTGWGGFVVSLSGALVAPCVLSMLHGGKGPGMGDIKLAAALGAILGPPLGSVVILLSAVAGGFLAALWMLRAAPLQDTPLGPALFVVLNRLFPQRGGERPGKPGKPIGGMFIPYGIALGVGTVATLVVCWSTGVKQWFF